MRAACVLIAVLAACGDNARMCEPGIGPIPPRESLCTADCVDAFVVAHEDDDLLFMNPDIIAAWQQGHAIHVIFVTAGELSDPTTDAYWMGREAGSVAAYSFLAGDDAWTFSIRDVPTSDDGVFRLATYARPRLTLSFLRLGDYQTQALWEQSAIAVTKATPDLPAQQLTREGLVDVLVSLLADSTRISSLDSTALYFDMFGSPEPTGHTEYWDHYYSALFTLTAATRVQAAANRLVEVSSYRGYTINAELPNVPTPQACSKLEMFARYAVHDTAIIAPERVDETLDCPECAINGGYGLLSASSWQRRQYSTSSMRGTGRLSDGTQCLALDGENLVLGACEGAPVWTVTDRHQLGTEDGRCLRIAAAVHLGDCTRTIESTLFVTTTGQIRTANAGCLAAEEGVIVSTACTASPGQLWTFR